MKAQRFQTIFLCAVIVLLLGDRALALSKPAAGQAGAGPQQAGFGAGFAMPLSLSGAGYVNVPPAAFQSIYNSYSYVVGTRKIIPENGTSYMFIAPVYLPHGATITTLTFFWLDTHPSADGDLALTAGYPTGYLSGGDPVEVAYVKTNDSLNVYRSSETTYINFPTVDTFNFNYSLTAYLPYNNDAEKVSLAGARIEYTFPAYLPFIKR